MKGKMESAKDAEMSRLSIFITQLIVMLLMSFYSS